MAEGALKRWVSSGNVTVTGIQEIPQENAAKVDVTFSNFKFKTTESWADKLKGIILDQALRFSLITTMDGGY